MRTIMAAALVAMAVGCGGSSEDDQGGATGSGSGGAGSGMVTGPDGKPTIAKLEYVFHKTLGTPRLLHSQAITAIVAHPDGAHLVTSSMDGTAVMWRTSDFAAVCAIEAGHGVLDVAVSPDGKEIATCDAQQFVRVWDAASGKATERELMFNIRRGAHTRSVGYAEQGKKIIAGATLAGLFSGDGERVEGGQGSAVRIAVSKDGRWIATADPNSAVSVFTGAPLAKKHTLKQGGHDAEFDAAGATLAVISDDGTIKLWDPESGQEKMAIGKLPVKGRSIAISPDGRLVAAGGVDGLVVLFDATGKRLGELVGHGCPVTALAFTAKGDRLLSGDEAGVLRWWDPAAGKAAHPGKGHAGRIRGLAFSRDGRLLHSAGEDGQLCSWDAKGGTLASSAQWHSPITAFATDGEAIAVGAENGKVALVLGSTWKDLAALDKRVNAIAIAPKLVMCGLDANLRVVALDRTSGAVAQEWKVNDDSQKVYSMAVDPAGTYCLYGSKDSDLTRRIVLADRSVGPTIGGASPPVYGLAVSGDGKWVAIAGSSAIDCVPTDGQKNHRCEYSATQFRGVAIHPGGLHLAAAVHHKHTPLAGIVALYKRDDREAIAHLKHHLRPADCVAFSPDGAWLATAGVDGSIDVYTRK